MSLGIEINSARFTCPNCNELISFHRQYFEPGEAKDFKCRFCGQISFVGLNVSSNISDFSGNKLWKNIKDLAKHHKKERENES